MWRKAKAQEKKQEKKKEKKKKNVMKNVVYGHQANKQKLKTKPNIDFRHLVK